jgi:hypothetical protein
MQLPPRHRKELDALNDDVAEMHVETLLDEPQTLRREVRIRIFEILVHYALAVFHHITQQDRAYGGNGV